MSLKTDIEGALPGTRIRLPEEVLLTDTITVPVGVLLTGGSLIGEFLTLLPMLVVSAGVVLKDVSLKLGPYAKGIAGTANNVRIHGLEVIGSEAEFGNGGKAVDLIGTNLHAEGCWVENTYGGIYLEGTDLTIRGNTLRRVNFGNLCTAGSRVTISHNDVEDSGIANAFHHASGDGITISGSVYSVLGNKIRRGRCYGIGAFSQVSNAIIRSNDIEDGATSGLYMVNAAGVLIGGNSFRQNAAHGVALINPSHVAVTRNDFYADTLFVDGGSNGQYTPNTYVLSEGLIQ